MRIPDREALFIGQNRCPEFDYPQDPLPTQLSVLLCLLDGSERRHQLQAKLNALRLGMPQANEPSYFGQHVCAVPNNAR